MYDDDGNLIPDPLANLVPGKFALNGEGQYDGFYYEAVRWNGFYVPYFTRQVAEEILRDFHDADWVFDWYYEEETDNFLVFDNEVDFETFEVTGSGHYSIGGFFWVWQKVN